MVGERVSFAALSFLEEYRMMERRLALDGTIRGKALEPQCSSTEVGLNQRARCRRRGRGHHSSGRGACDSFGRFGGSGGVMVVICCHYMLL